MAIIAATTSVTAAGKILGKLGGVFGGQPRRKSACDTISEGDLNMFLSNPNSNPAMQRVVKSRRRDWNMAFTGQGGDVGVGLTSLGVTNVQAVGGAPPVTDQELAELHVKVYVPLCAQIEDGRYTSMGSRSVTGSAVKKAAEAEFQRLLREGHVGVNGTRGSRSLTGGAVGPDGAGGIPRPSGSTGTPLTAGFGGVSPIALVLGLGVLAFAVVRR